jgi:hypothetical protein
VRLPDEIPPAEPAVRLVLDHQLIGADRFSCRAPAELLDALVRVWLGVGRALVDAGVRVDLVAATRRGDGWVRTCRPLRARGALGDGEALRLGARVGWQGSLPLTSLVDGDAGRARCVVVSSRPRPVEGRDDLLWIVVPEVVWTTPEAWPPPPSYLSLPFPIGSPENRLSHRIRAKSDAAAARRDGAIFNDLLCWTDWTALRGAFVARPSGTRVALEVIP